MKIDYEKLEDNLPDGDFSGFLVIGDNHFGDVTEDLSPSDVKEEIGELSGKLGIDEDLTYDLLSPVFSSETFDEYFEDEYLDFEKIMKESENDGGKMSDEESEEFEDKIESLEEELQEKEEKLQEKEEELQEYKEKVEEFKEKHKETIVDNIVSVKEEKQVYSEEEDIEEDRERLSEKNTDVLEEVLEMAQNLPEPKEYSTDGKSKITETPEDFNDEEDKKKALEKQMFGDNKAYQ